MLQYSLYGFLCVNKHQSWWWCNFSLPLVNILRPTHLKWWLFRICSNASKIYIFCTYKQKMVNKISFCHFHTWKSFDTKEDLILSAISISYVHLMSSFTYSFNHNVVSRWNMFLNRNKNVHHCLYYIEQINDQRIRSVL